MICFPRARTSFLVIKDLADGKANTVYNALHVVQEKGLDIDDAAGFGSDGASVMVGRQTGVRFDLSSVIFIV